MDTKKAVCRDPDIGKSFILCGDSGSGKSTAVHALVHGKSGHQPDRSLTIRFKTLNLQESEKIMIERMKRLPHIEREQKSVIDLAFFVLDSVVKNEKEISRNCN
jgi:GTPase SAR1 family protein